MRLEYTTNTIKEIPIQPEWTGVYFIFGIIMFFLVFFSIKFKDDNRRIRGEIIKGYENRVKWEVLAI